MAISPGLAKQIRAGFHRNIVGTGRSDEVLLMQRDGPLGFVPVSAKQAVAAYTGDDPEFILNAIAVRAGRDETRLDINLRNVCLGELNQAVESIRRLHKRAAPTPKQQRKRSSC